MKRPEFLILLVILIISLFIRYFNFENRITFWSEQSRSLLVSGRYITERPSFLGQEYFRVTSEGHKLFSGALFSYTLVPLQMMFNYDPLLITLFSPLLNVITGLILFLLFKKLFNWEIALFSSILFLFNNYMIHHSMFIWILNYYPLIGLLALYFLFLYYKQRTLKNVFIVGLINGIAVNFQYFFLPFGLLIFLYMVFANKEKIKSAFLFLAGSLIGDFTMVLFDIRHDFYHLKTVLQYGLDFFTAKGEGNIVYFHFLHLWPLFALIGGFLVYRLWKLNKIYGFLVIAIYLFLNLNSSLVSFTKPIGMPEGILYKDVMQASLKIAESTKGNFNVVELLDFDTRAYVFRYPLEFLYGKRPLSPEEYKNAQTLYVLAEKEYNLNEPTVWELKVFEPYKYAEIAEVGEGYSLFRLSHE